MGSPPAASVVIRAKDEAESIGRVLETIAAQDLGDREVEVIVVDSGSADRTREIARDHGARVLSIPAEEFTFGGALNTGCEAARGAIIVALSAHAIPRDDNWLAGMLACFEDDAVACVYGCDNAPQGGALEGRLVQDRALAERFPFWGYGNGAGAFRATLWRERPFRSDMPGTEDREWAWYWLQRGHVAVVDPDLRVDHDHSHDPLADVFRRYRREWRGYTMYLDMPRYGVRELVRDWWRDWWPWPSRLRACLSPQRNARLLGTYVGLRPTRRRRP